MMEQMTASISLNNLEEDIRFSFQLISYLLQYPEKNWLQLKELIEEKNHIEALPVKEQVAMFLSQISEMCLDELKEHYVELFDFNKDCTLSLSYLKAGEQRERGQILVELKSLYREYGYEMIEEELSDFLPVVLEFASVAPLEISINLLTSLHEPLEKLLEELTKAKSPYRHLIVACKRGTDLLRDAAKEKVGK